MIHIEYVLQLKMGAKITNYYDFDNIFLTVKYKDFETNNIMLKFTVYRCFLVFIRIFRTIVDILT